MARREAELTEGRRMGRRSPAKERSSAGGGDVEMMRLVADLYYLRDHSQPDIAELTGFSISKVSRLLSQAMTNPFFMNGPVAWVSMRNMVCCS